MLPVRGAVAMSVRGWGVQRFPAGRPTPELTDCAAPDGQHTPHSHSTPTPRDNPQRSQSDTVVENRIRPEGDGHTPRHTQRQIAELLPRNMLAHADAERSFEYARPVGTGGNPSNRTTARKAILDRKQRLDAEQRRREERETDLATDYLLACVERDRARETLRRSEAKIGHVIDTMLDELGVSYPRLTELLELSEPELKRLRKLAHEATPGTP